MNNKKMITTAGHLDTVLRITEGLMTVFAIVFAVFVVLAKLFGEKLTDGSFTLDLDFIKLHLAQDAIAAGVIQNRMEVILFTGLIGCIFIRYGLGFLRRILAPMKEGRPFEEEVAVNLKKVAWLLLIGGGLIQVIGLAERALLVRDLPMDAIFSAPAIHSVEYVFTLDFGFVWLFCVVRFLAQIFAYGQQLQQESDETL